MSVFAQIVRDSSEKFAIISRIFFSKIRGFVPLILGVVNFFLHTPSRKKVFVKIRSGIYKKRGHKVSFLLAKKKIKKIKNMANPKTFCIKTLAHIVLEILNQKKKKIQQKMFFFFFVFRPWIDNFINQIICEFDTKSENIDSDTPLPKFPRSREVTLKISISPRRTIIARFA